MKKILALLTFLFAITHTALAASPAAWNLPLQLNSSNTKLEFTVDSTWVLVDGSAQEISGVVELANPADYSSIKGTILFPVEQLETGVGLRDKKLKRNMAIKDYPNVKFEIAKIDNLCSPAQITAEKPCEATLIGDLTIRGHSKHLNIPITIEIEEEDLHVLGGIVIQWREFGIEDPSIMVAKLHEDVNVNFDVKVPRN